MSATGTFRKLCALIFCMAIISGCASVGAGTPAESPYLSGTGSYRNEPGKGLALIKTSIDSTQRDYAVVLARMDPGTGSLELRDDKPVTFKLRAAHAANPEYGTSVMTAKNGAYHLVELPVGTYVVKNLREVVSRKDTYTSCLLENSIAFEVTDQGISYVGDVMFEPAIKQKGSGMLVMTHLDGPARIVDVGRNEEMARRFLARHPNLAATDLIKTGTREATLAADKTIFGKVTC